MAILKHAQSQKQLLPNHVKLQCMCCPACEGMKPLQLASGSTCHAGWASLSLTHLHGRMVHLHATL